MSEDKIIKQPQQKQPQKRQPFQDGKVSVESLKGIGELKTKGSSSKKTTQKG